MGSVEFNLPQRLVAELSRALGIEMAVETGTFRGDSTALLAETVPRVVSIEISQTLHEAAKARFAGTDGVTLLHGSSADLLPGVVNGFEGPAIYWLDGHWCEGDGTGGYEDQCPILAEIAAIDMGVGAERSCVLIDDARFYLGPPPPPFRRDDWPTLAEVVDALRAKHSERCFTVLDDVIIAGPLEIQAVIDKYWLDKQWRTIVSERNDLRRRVWSPTAAQAARSAVKALRARKLI